MMKRIFTLMLCILMLVPCFVGCGSGEEEKGAIIPMYITNPIYNLDPAVVYTNDDAVKVIGLLFEGLMKINSNGKLQKALAKSYKIIEKNNEYKMQITLKNTKWNDGREVSADDVIYAWKRVLDPEFACEASALLFDIKNARKVKSGDASIDDLGLAAVDNKIVEITFEGKIDYDSFLLNLASVALVPLREDIVSRSEDWAKKPSTIVTNGPFMLRQMVYGERMVLERSSYYYRNSDKGDKLTKYVNPYKLVVLYADDSSELLEMYKNGEIFYLDEIPLAERASYAKKAKKTDLLSTHAYYFNLNNELFKDANVRKALSLAIDREAIADLVVFAKPATGFVPFGVYNALKSGKSFRKVGGNLIDKNADMEEAQRLLDEAGVSGGKFTITYKDGNEVDEAIAEYIEEAWEELGFSVSLKSIEARESFDSTYCKDDFVEAYRAGDFDVIAIDMQAVSPDAFGVLAPFAKEFSGQSIDMANQNYDLHPHVTGFDNEEYNQLIEDAFAEKDISKRAKILHEAEELLLEEMPIIPIIFNQDAYIASGKLSGIKTNWYGTRELKGLKLKNYLKYKPGYEELGW